MWLRLSVKGRLGGSRYSLCILGSEDNYVFVFKLFGLVRGRVFWRKGGLFFGINVLLVS